MTSNKTLQAATHELVGYIRNYESDTFSATYMRLDRLLAERMAALLIQNLIDDLDGLTLANCYETITTKKENK